jgi:hypothetical protein
VLKLLSPRINLSLVFAMVMWTAPISFISPRTGTAPDDNYIAVVKFGSIAFAFSADEICST